MTPTQASLDALKAAAQARSADSRRRINLALRELIKNNESVNVQAVARRAGVTRATVHRHTDLLAKVNQHRRAGTPTIVAEPARSDDSIVSALRMQIRQRDKAIADLKQKVKHLEDTVATLHGEIDRLS
ncbi:DUF6262 family protein [Gordonia aichiensis]